MDAALKRVVLPALVGRARGDIGGVAAYLLALEKHLAREGIEVTLLAYGPPEHREPGFEPILHHTRPRGRDLTFALWRRRRSWDFPPGTVVHIQRPDQALGFMDPRWPLVLSFHGCHSLTVLQRQGKPWAAAYAWLQRRAVARADAILFETRRDHEAFLAAHPEQGSKTRFVPLGIDRERFGIGDRDAARRELGLPLDVPAVAYLGRLEPEKNVLALVRAMEGIPDMELWIAGKGSEESMLRAEANERVRFLGFLSNEEVPVLLQAADGLTLASHHEGLATVVLQAWASGRPVVVPPVGDFPELLRESGGVLARDNSVGGMIEALGRFRTLVPRSPAERETAEDALRTLSAPYDWGQVVKEHLEVYEAVLALHGEGGA